MRVKGDRFWIKLTDELFNSQQLKRLEKREDGHSYVLLLLHLLSDTKNTGGVFLVDMGGDDWQPMDAESIHDEHTSFSVEFIQRALVVYRNMGFISYSEDGFLQFNNYDELTNTKTAAKQQRYRDRKAAREAAER